MYLTRHNPLSGPPQDVRWAVDGHLLAPGLTLATLLSLESEAMQATIRAAKTDEPATGPVLAPIEDAHEVWACGVTYLRSREARVAESDSGDVYERVYDAERVEIFFKATGWRVRGPDQAIRVRADSHWNVPEPELTLVLNAAGTIVGYTVGNDVSSRDIEGENPLYLPQAKVYDGSCALGPGILLTDADAQRALPITMHIERASKTVFEGETTSAQLKRGLEEMAGYMFREMAFPGGAFLMTGTCLVPPDEYTLTPGDKVRIGVGNLALENVVGT
ncbi:MAG: 2-dehydro-3-deoxy-D-arabinonate dehydratase [Gammaproteobacteria bacterium]